MGNNICRPCQANCKKCINSYSCSECEVDYFIQVNGPVACDLACKEEYFEASTYPFSCIPCFSNCLECDEDKCTKCKPLYIAKPPPVDNSDACLPCSKNCISCEYKDSKTVCTECDSGFYYQPEGYENELECDSKCPDGYHIDIFTISCKECPVGKYGFGTECIDCERPCTVCSRVDKCSECIENAVLVNERCACLSNFEFDGMECVGKYFYLDLEFRNDTLILKFKYPLKESLTVNDFDIFIDGVQYMCDKFIIESSDLQTFYIKSEIFLVTSDKILILNIKDDLSIFDIYNHTLIIKQFSIQIPTHENQSESEEESDQALSNTQEKKLEQTRYMEILTALIVRIVVGICTGVALINMNPSIIWNLLNNIQVMSYINMINITIPPRTQGVCTAFSSFNFIPNIFKFLIDKREFELESRYTDNNIETSQILINTGKILTILSVLITTYLLLKLIQTAISRYNNDSCFVTILNSILRRFEWNIFTRFYIQTYMEISFASMLNLSNFNVSDLTLAMDFMLSCISFLITLISPFYLLYFLIKNSARLDDSDFKLKWSSLYGVFKPYEYTIIFNIAFFARRFLYAVGIVFLGSSPHIQLIFCSLLSYFMFYYTLFHQPYKFMKENILINTSEGCTLLSLCILYAYSFEIGYTVFEYLDYGIVIILYASFLIPVVSSLIEVFIKVVKKCIKRRKDNEVDTYAIHLSNARNLKNLY